MDLTLVLVGLTGDGKSATGNSILGREAFISGDHTSTVTQTCELQTRVLEDGQTISVIDTPSGFLDTEPELLGEEVKKCFHLARNKIHAILFVVSVEQKISKEVEKDAVGKLKTIFGENIINYIIVVTCGDDAFVGFSFLLGIHKIARLCQGRYVHFHNKTTNEMQTSQQIQFLLSLVKKVISNNGGLPFISHEFELELQVESTVRDATTRLEQQPVEVHATTMNASKEQINDVVEARLRDTTTRLEQQMEAATLKADERAEKYFKEATSELIQQMTQRINEAVSSVKDVTTRLEQQLAEAELKADERAQEAQKNSDDQIQTLKEVLERAESRVKDVTTKLEQQLAEAEAARLKADERAQEAQKNSDEHIQKLKEVLAEAEAARMKVDERAQEAQKNSDEHIQKLKEVLERAESRRSETIPEFESSSFHVYDPSTYLLQSTIK